MGRITASLNVTPDGFCNHDAVVADDQFTKFATAQVRKADVLLLGRNTYDLFAGYWPQAASDPDRDPVERALGEAIVGIPRVVVSRSLKESDWDGTTIVRDLGAVDDAGETLQLGSPSIHSQLLGQGRIDRLSYLVHPMIVGKGVRLFGNGGGTGAAVNPTCTSLTTFASGVRVIEYERG